MDEALPSASVVVPTHARPEQLAACIGALDRLRYPVDRLEIVVVDDGSPTPAAVRADRADLPRLRLLRQVRSGPATARNTGALAAEGDVVAFVDDDCAPDGDWLRILVAHLHGGRTLAGGRTVNALDRNLFAEASQALVSYLYDYYAAKRPEHRFFTTNNLALLRSDFEELGGFDARFRRAAGEDREFCVRATSRGFRLSFDERAIVRHHHDLRLRSVWRQHVAYGRAAYTFRQAPDSALGPRRLEPARFYAGLLRYPRRSGLRRPARTSALIVVSQLANALGYAAARLGTRRKP